MPGRAVTIVAAWPCANAPASSHYALPPDSIGTLKACWYTEQLDTLQEPDLREWRDQGDTVVRFLWLRTFHQPVAVRVVGQGARWIAVVSVADGEGGYQPGHLVIRDTVPLGRPQVDSLVALLDAVNFRTAETMLPSTGLDGAEWVFEYRSGPTYLLRERWSPAGPDGFHALGIWFIDLIHHPDVTHFLY